MWTLGELKQLRPIARDLGANLAFNISHIGRVEATPEKQDRATAWEIFVGFQHLPHRESRSNLRDTIARSLQVNLSTSPTSGESKQPRPFNPFSTNAFSLVFAKGRKCSFEQIKMTGKNKLLWLNIIC